MRHLVLSAGKLLHGLPQQRYPPARWNPNLYGYYGYYVPPGYALGTPYYVLGYPVPHYGYRPWRRWWW